MMMGRLSDMERSKIEEMKSLYAEHQKLHTVGDMMSIPWQTVYWWLKKEGVSVTGNKSKYGGKSDQTALIGERLFSSLGTDAVDQNKLYHQPKYDFLLGNVKIDVKTSFIKDDQSRSGNINKRWAFNTKKGQEADYLVCYCLSGDLSSYEVVKILLIPKEFIEGMQCISVSINKSKWGGFEVNESGLFSFFKDQQKLK